MLPANRSVLERLAMPLTAGVTLIWVFAPGSPVTAAASFATAVLHAIRLSGWRGLSVWRDPLLFVLHVAFAWLIVGYLLLGASAIWPQVSGSPALHALTMGGIGTMAMAMMSRAALGHTGRPLIAPAAVVGAYALVTLAVFTRVLASWIPALHAELLTASGSLWVTAFLVFLVVYWLILTGPRIQGS